MSCILCCFKCLALCGCRDYLMRQYAFYPPKPTYKFKLDENKIKDEK